MRYVKIYFENNHILALLMVKQSVVLMLGLLAACTTVGSSSNTAGPTSSSKSLSPSEPVDVNEEADRKEGVLRVDRNAPGALQVMRDSCRGQYKVLTTPETNPPQMEIGVARTIGGKADSGASVPYPYIRYRCEN